MTKKQLRNTPLNSSTWNTYEIDTLNAFDNNSSNSNGRKFQRYIQVLNQMIGLISVKGDKYFEKRQNELMSCVFTNGQAVITYIDNKLQIWSVAGDIKYDINGDVEYVDVIPYVSLYNNAKTDIKKRRFSGNSCVIIKANPHGFSLWFLWNQIISDNIELMEIYLTNAKLNVKKLQYIVNNESVSIADEEIKSILDYKSPVLKTINPITKMKSGDIREASGEQNILTPLELSNGSYHFEDVVNHWVFESNLMGLFADEYHKKERNTEGENEFTQANTILLHNVILREFKKAEKEIKEKFNINVEFYKTMELTVENNNNNNKEGQDNE